MELTTSFFTLEELTSSDISSFDAIYLGDPFCRDYSENLSQNYKDLRKALIFLKQQNKKVYVSIYAVPRNDDLASIEETLRQCQDLKIDAVEIHNFGILRLARRKFPNLKIHMGCLTNIYTQATVLKLKEEKIKRFMANYELSLDEISQLKDASGLEVEILVHGKMVLGISEKCLLKRWLECPEDNCKDLCRKDYYLKSGSMSLKIFGRVTLSGKDVCMIEHLPLLLKRGFSKFRIETFGEKRNYAGKIGSIYKKALNDAKKTNYEAVSLLMSLSKFSPRGFCNGYYFAKSGQHYVPKS